MVSVVKIMSVANGKYMVAPEGIKNNSLIYCRGNKDEALTFIQVGPNSRCMFLLNEVQEPALFLSLRNVTGAVKLYDSNEDALFTIDEKERNCTIYNLYFEQYMWLSGDEPYITRSGDPSSPYARWIIEKV
jgi:hypothetical protein